MIERLGTPARVVVAASPTSAPVDSPELAIVIPLYNEVENVQRLHARVTEAVSALHRSYELVYVDDGSTDGTDAELAAIAAHSPEVRVVRFRRNFGQTAAIQAGIDHSTAPILVFMDGDLQNDPDDIARLLDRLDADTDVVSGWRRHRRDSFIRTFPSRLANALIARVTGVHIHDYGCTLKAYRREVLANVRLYGEMHRFIPAYAAWSGATIAELEVNHQAREFGSSKYGISRTLRVVLDLLTVKLLSSYSTKPIYAFGMVGIFMEGLAAVAAVEVLLEKVLYHTYVHANPIFLVGVMLAILGVNFVMMGLLAELVIRTYHESQAKPAYVVRQITQGSAAPAPKNAASAASVASGRRARRAPAVAIPEPVKAKSKAKARAATPAATPATAPATVTAPRTPPPATAARRRTRTG